MKSLSRIPVTIMAIMLLPIAATLACGGSAPPEASYAPASASTQTSASGQTGATSAIQRTAAPRTTTAAMPASESPIVPARSPGADGHQDARGSVGPPNTSYATALPQPASTGAPTSRGVPEQQSGPVIPPESGGTDNPNDGAYPLTYYEHYGVNPCIDADEDPLSTFALDGDTASYAILKQYLRDGYLVEPDSVRIEEYINSLPQGYPATETALGLHLDAGPAPFGDEEYVLLRVGVSNPAPTNDRDPVSLIFVVDVSGSMEADNRLGLAKEIIYGISEQMIPGDRAAIVTYANDVRVVRDFTNGDNAPDISNTARQLRPGGSTYAEAGLTKAYRPDSILKIVDEHAQRNAALSTIGVGITGNYNDVLMEVLANRGNGAYHYLANRDTAERFLQESVAGIFTETARDARIQVEFNPETVRKYRLIGYENRAVADEDFRDDSLDFGEVGFARDVSALYEVRLLDDAPGDATLAQARLRWLDPQTREPTELSATITVGQVSTALSATNPYFRQTAAAAEFAELLRGSYWAQCSDLDAVTGLLDTVETQLGENRSYQESHHLVGQADSLFEPTCKQ